MPLYLSSDIPLVILGAGYTGRFIYQLAKALGYSTMVTSRNPAEHLGFALPRDRRYFDLLLPETWSTIPNEAHIIWCFPALPHQEALTFAHLLREKHCRLILLGSTSAFPSGRGGWTDETAPLNLHLPRVSSEETLRHEFGATVLRLAGLYGPGRNVLDWVRKGRINNTNRYVNLIHIQDVAHICLAACTHTPVGDHYVVSDGTPRQWSAICRKAHEKWGIPLPPFSTCSDEGKRLSPRKLFQALGYQLQHPDLFLALSQLESTFKGDHYTTGRTRRN